MKSVSISGSPRANVGKTDATALRNAKQVPCVLYGGKEQIHFAVLAADFKDLIYTPDVHIVDLKIGEKKFWSYFYSQNVVSVGNFLRDFWPM